MDYGQLRIQRVDQEISRIVFYILSHYNLIMKKRYKKEVASLFIFLVFSSLISFSYDIKPVSAEQQENGCCEKTKQGNFCVETSRENCDTANGLYDPNAKCSDTSFCSEDRSKCCFYQANGDCTSNTLQKECLEKGGQAQDNNDCGGVSQCQKGCAKIGSQCKFVTQREYEILSESYSNAQKEFIANIENEFACQQRCLQQENGCCISEGAYTLTIESECNGTFHKNKLCSALENSPCRAHTGGGCYDGNLFWEDSCGNKEDLKEECKYNEGKFCKDNEEENRAVCVDVNCQETYKDQWNVHDPKIGGLRQNGESWCIYESPTGNFLDRPGSRHYKHACLNGEEIGEPCRDFREEVCIQGSSGGSQNLQQRDISGIPFYDFSQINQEDAPLIFETGFTGARCTENDPDVYTVPRGFAFWKSQNFGGLDLIGLLGLFGLGNRLGQLNNILNLQQMRSGFEEKNTNAPRTEPSSNSNSVCSKADETVTVKWLVCPTGGSKCIENCWAEKEIIPGVGKWITKKAEDCKALGDCGVDFGVESNLPSGFSSFIVFWRGSAPGPRPIGINPANVFFWGAARGVYGGMKFIGNEFSEFLTLLRRASSGFWQRGGGSGGSKFDAGAAGIGAGIGATVGLIGGIFPGSIIGAIIGALVGLFGFKCKEETKTVTVTCRPWQPLSGGTNCHLCRQPDKYAQIKSIDGKPFNTCTEYRCKALGKSCEYVETLEGADCIDKNPGDSNSPIISPNMDILGKQGFQIEDRGREGFTIKNLLPAFEPIVLAINTDELAQCSYTTKINEAFNEFDQYTNPITTGLTKDHQLIIRYPPSDPRKIIETIYYIKCQDNYGISNDAPYTINFKVNPEPDLEPPKITNIVGPKYLKAGETKTMVTALIDDAYPVECKFSKQDIAYDSIGDENKMLCTSDRPDTISFYCHAELKDLNVGENKFYIKCKDSSERQNVMTQPFDYTIVGTEALEVVVVAPSPSGTVFSEDITLAVQTQKGAEQGKAKCQYSSNDGQFIEFKTTGETLHLQSQTDLQMGHYSYNIKCQDVAGNEASTKIEFDVSVDTDQPSLLNVYKQSGFLYIILNEATTCEAKNQQFTYGNGIRMTEVESTTHSIELQFPRYFVNCVDAVNNALPQYEIVP